MGLAEDDETLKNIVKNICFKAEPTKLSKNIVKTDVLVQKEAPLEAHFQKHRKTEGFLVAFVIVFCDVFEKTSIIHCKN